MGRKKHPGGTAGTWIEVKVIKGRSYWYERTRVYLDAGQSCIKSKYLGPGPRRTPHSAAAELHESAKAHGHNQPSSNDGPTNNSKSPPRAAAGGGKNKGPQPKSADVDGGQTVPITLVTNRQ